ncbi:MAG: hypothetical protein RLZZ584_2465 [Pseudomonadota bacterium]
MSCACGRTEGGCGAEATPAPQAADSAAIADGCSGGEPIALQVLGDTMLPEFRDGDIVVIEPDGALGEGSFVLAQVEDDWQLRQLEHTGSGWTLRRLNPAAGEAAVLPIADLSAIWGVVIQRSVPGRRRERKSYLRPQGLPAAAAQAPAVSHDRLREAPTSAAPRP